MVGATGLAVGVVCLLLVVSKGGDWGWTSTTALGLYLASVVVLLLWGVWEWHRPEPLVNMRVSARRQILITNLTAVMVGFGTYAIAYPMTQLLQLPKVTGYGLGPSRFLTSSLYVAPSGVVMLLTSPLAARLSGRWGPHRDPGHRQWRHRRRMAVHPGAHGRRLETHRHQLRHRPSASPWRTPRCPPW